ncbi:2OG-Fe dioxygenase family protein [Amycolatopsis sp. 195334CR]|uniref:2OG-Fe dioxygenase family protein n=1 Tax=Amycolatopsis sp. 195334CR TaxID=2814588 RepID=UPI0027DB8710|nr:2OG-Fe dioxygenase family protein [Amycolatopsis sp. 195334CR]
MVITDRELGLPGSVRENIHRDFFQSGVLRNYPGDIPADRERARDVIRYDWHGDELSLREHDCVAIDRRGDWSSERREFEQVPLLGHADCASWIHAAISLVPEPRRQPRGTFGVNLFRTHTNVVTRPHQDEEEFIFVYVVDKRGSGAETVLLDVESDAVVLEETLDPGDLLVFEDSRFRHGTTPIIPPVIGTARRDALVCTINFPHTYPLED